MERRLTYLVARMKEAGYKATEPRMAILELFAANREHPSAPEVYEKLRQTHPHMGLATVYRVLELLTKAGVLKAVQLGDGCLRYEANWPGDHHHHLVCEVCGDILEFRACELSKLEAELARLTEFEIRGHVVQILGLCPRCKSSNLGTRG